MYNIIIDIFVYGETNALSAALRMYKLVLKLQTADQCAAFWDNM